MLSIAPVWKAVERFHTYLSAQPETRPSMLSAWESWSSDTTALGHEGRKRIVDNIVGNPRQTQSRKEQRLAKLQTLDASYNQLTSLPELPSKLQTLDASYNQLTSLPELPSKLQTLDASYNQLTSLPELPSKLQTLDARNNQLTSLPELPSKLQTLDASYNQLTSLPELPSKLQTLDARNNQLTSLPELPSKLQTLDARNNQLTSLPELPSKLQWLDARDNQLRMIPTQLLQKHLKTEVDLRNNPLRREQIAILMQEIRQRRARGEQTPTFIFDEELHNDPHNLGNLTDTNVHNRRLVGVFRTQLHQLLERYPDLIASETPFNFEQLHASLLEDLHAVAQRHPELNTPEFGSRGVIDLAKDAIQSMCEQGKNGSATMDFNHSAGHVLAYVHRYIKDQPPDQEDAGFVQLFRHLSYARGNNEQTQLYCPTRHVEEALTALQSAYDMHSGIPFEQARELMQKLGKRVLLPLLEAPAHAETTVQDLFTQRFREALAEHPNVTQEQIDQYLNDFVCAHWETYCDVARES